MNEYHAANNVKYEIHKNRSKSKETKNRVRIYAATTALRSESARHDSIQRRGFSTEEDIKVNHMLGLPLTSN